MGETKEPIVMFGPNIVVKGPPYLPSKESQFVMMLSMMNVNLMGHANLAKHSIKQI